MNSYECSYCLRKKHSLKLSLKCSHQICSNCSNSLPFNIKVICPICVNASQDTFLDITQDQPKNKSQSNKSQVSTISKSNPTMKKTKNSIQIPPDEKTISKLSSDFKSEIENFKKQQKEIQIFLILSKLSHSSPELYDPKHLEIKKIVSLMKKEKIFELAKVNHNITEKGFINRMMIKNVKKLSYVILRRELKYMEEPRMCIWLGSEVSIYSEMVNNLNDYIKISSDLPILIEYIGVGQSANGSRNLIYSTLTISDEKRNIIGSYQINDYRPRLNFQFTKRIHFPEPLLLESGVNYSFIYTFEETFAYIILNDKDIRYKNYTFSTGGASLTCYLKIKEVCS